MTTRPRLLPALIGIAAGLFAGWGLYHLLLIGSCSTPPGPGEVACPPGSEQYFFAIAGGMVGGIVSTIAGGSWVSFYALFAGIGGAGVAAGRRADGQGWFVWFGLCFLLSPLLGVSALIFGGAKRLKAARLMSNGVQAVGTVLAVEDTGITINSNPRVRLRFRIEPTDGAMAPYEATKTATVSRVEIPRVGDRFPVWVDPNDPNTWMFATGVPDATAPPSLRRLVELAKHGATPAVPPVPVGGAVSELNTLNELRLAGKITADEFAVRTSDLLRRNPV